MMRWIFCFLFFSLTLNAFADEDPWYKTAPSCVIDRGNPGRTGEYKEKPLVNFNKVLWSATTKGLSKIVCGGDLIFPYGDSWANGFPVAQDIKTGQVKWTSNQKLSKSLVYKNTLYSNNGPHKGIISYDVHSGKLLFPAKNQKVSGDFKGLIYNDIAYLSQENVLVAYQVTTHKILWEKPYTGTLLKLSTDGTRLYITSLTEIIALDLATKEIVWTAPYKTNGYVSVSHEFVYFASTYEQKSAIDKAPQFYTKIYVLNAESGQLAWQEAVKGNMNAQDLAVSNGKVFVPEYDALYAFDAKNGKLLWQAVVKLQGDISISQGVIYASNPDSIYAIDATTGKILNRFKLTPPGSSSDVAMDINTIVPYQDSIFMTVSRGEKIKLLAIQ